MISWTVKLLEYDIHYVPKGSIKSQALTDLVAEYSSVVDEDTPIESALSVDGPYNIKGSGIRIVLEGHVDTH